jgi:serine phosphatase RsbU (regulator of sigma subunit)/anti-sigma regulatory factor (Ser/Thr protein kinase)
VSAIDDRRVAASLRLLIGASRQLSSSFDYPDTLAAVAGLVVPAFADGFAVEIDEGGIRRTIASAGSVDARVRAIPLVARGTTLGILRIAGAIETDADGEIDMWEELAIRIAVAIDAAQICAREHHVADALQRALLPESLPADERIRFDASYLPASGEAIVGGDWYDAFRLPDGRIAISIGDVAGHGLRAAIVMGEVRQAFRAAALGATSPARVLDRANTIVNMRANPIMVTALFGIVDPNDATVVYASAGHPPPLLALPCGSVQALPADGVPLGIVDSIDATDWLITVPPGGLLTLYTDGMIEYSRNILEGADALVEAVRGQVLERHERPAGAIIDRAFPQRENRDDVATLTLRSVDLPSPTFSFALSAIPVAVPLVRRSLQRFVQRLEIDEERRFAILTATGEAVANAVEHAYNGSPGTVRVSARLADGAFVVSVEDEGTWKPAQRREERGRGLPLMRALMDAVEIRTHQARTEIRLTLALPNTRAAL